MKPLKTVTGKCNLLCLVLMLALVVCQFLPFWTYEGEQVSIQEYVWMPTANAHFEEYFEAATGEEYNINHLVTSPVMTIIFCGAGILLCCLKPAAIYTDIVALLGGLFASYGYLFKSILRLGNLWGLHLTLAILICIVSICAMIPLIKEFIEDRR